MQDIEEQQRQLCGQRVGERSPVDIIPVCKPVASATSSEREEDLKKLT